MSMKAFKFRLYPTKKQVETLEWTLARCCELYNACLQERRDTWVIIKRHPNFYNEEWRKQAAKDHRVNYYHIERKTPCFSYGDMSESLWGEMGGLSKAA